MEQALIIRRFVEKHGELIRTTSKEVVTNYNELIEKVFSDSNTSFNKEYILEIEKTDKHKLLSERCLYGNNIKQILLWQMILNDKKETYVRSKRSTMRNLEVMERKFHKPYWDFNREELNQTATFLGKTRNPHSVASSFSEIASLIDQMNKLFKENGHATVENNWRKANKKKDIAGGNISMRNTHKNKFITRPRLMHIIAQSDDPSASAIALLVFKGVKLEEDREIYLTEMSLIKKEDIADDYIQINGPAKRKIWLNAVEMNIIRRAASLHKGTYLFGPKRLTLNDGNAPLRRWALMNRFKSLDPHDKNEVFNYSNVRTSGFINYVNNELMRMYGSLDVNDNILRQVVYAGIEAFGYYTREEILGDTYDDNRSMIYQRARRLINERIQFMKLK